MSIKSAVKAIRNIRSRDMGCGVVVHAPKVFDRGDKYIIADPMWVDYWGGDYPWISQHLEDLADRHGCYLEWESPEAVYLCEL